MDTIQFAYVASKGAWTITRLRELFYKKMIFIIEKDIQINNATYSGRIN